jgi:hypothetical protein
MCLPDAAVVLLLDVDDAKAVLGLLSRPSKRVAVCVCRDREEVTGHPAAGEVIAPGPGNGMGVEGVPGLVVAVLAREDKGTPAQFFRGDVFLGEET